MELLYRNYFLLNKKCNIILFICLFIFSTHIIYWVTSQKNIQEKLYNNIETSAYQFSSNSLSIFLVDLNHSTVGEIETDQWLELDVNMKIVNMAYDLIK